MPKVLKQGHNGNMSSASSLKSTNTIIKNPQLVFNKFNHIKDPKEAILMASNEMSGNYKVASSSNIASMNDKKLKRILLSNASKLNTSLHLNKNN